MTDKKYSVEELTSLCFSEGIGSVAQIIADLQAKIDERGNSLQSAYGDGIQICQVKGLIPKTEIQISCRPDEMYGKINEFLGSLNIRYDSDMQSLFITFKA